MALIGGAFLFVQAVEQRQRDGGRPPLGISWLVLFVMLFGLFMVNPNEGRVLQLFGDYEGRCKVPGLRWANPFFTKKRVSLRVRNFETASRLKVNDVDGNPIEMRRWWSGRSSTPPRPSSRSTTTSKFVTVAAEAAMRKLAMSYPYDTHEDHQLSLRGSPDEIAEHLRTEMQERLALAGVEVLEARISNLSYAPEIAQAMLRRQQAGGGDRRPPEDRRRIGGHGGDGPRAAVQEEHRRAGRGAEGGDGQQPAGGAVQRELHPADHQHRHALSVTVLAERKPFLLRLDPAVLEALQRWAGDDLRSLNGQIEYLLRRALQAAGRLPGPEPDKSKAVPKRPPDLLDPGQHLV